MRDLIAPVSIATALLLGACASDVTGNRHETEYRRLSDECRERGGILAPTGEQTGQPRTENVCKITGEPSDRVRPRPGGGSN